VQVSALCVLALSLVTIWIQADCVNKETFHILPKVGVMMTSYSVSGATASRFLDWHRTGPIIINEVAAPSERDYLWLLMVSLALYVHFHKQSECKVHSFPC
jgi:hypothetical protein